MSRVPVKKTVHLFDYNDSRNIETESEGVQVGEDLWIHFYSDGTFSLHGGVGDKLKLESYDTSNLIFSVKKEA